MPFFTKKPVTIEAMQLTPVNIEAVESFVGGDATVSSGRVIIATLEGAMTASVGDWVIKGVKGEFYPCKPDIFDATYNPAS